VLSSGTTEVTEQTAGVDEAALIGLPILSKPEFSPLTKRSDDAKKYVLFALYDLDATAVLVAFRADETTAYGVITIAARLYLKLC
jgi:hypothetical protein